jgi:hypothetical protein
VSAVNDAAILFFAANGTMCELRCLYFLHHANGASAPCGAPMTGVSADDGAPLCAEHMTHPSECAEAAHPLSAEVMAEIQRIAAAMREMKDYPYTAKGI